MGGFKCFAFVCLPAAQTKQRLFQPAINFKSRPGPYKKKAQRGRGAAVLVLVLVLVLALA